MPPRTKLISVMRRLTVISGPPRPPRGHRLRAKLTSRLSYPQEILLSVRDLSVAFCQGPRETLAVDNVSFDVARGETVALVGESGSGKSVTALSIMKLLPHPAARHPCGAVLFKGQELLDLPEPEMRRVRGNEITIIFQEPMTSLNPLHTIEKQICEILLLHRGIAGPAARKRAIDLLGQVGIRDPESRLGSYPHQLSGGQRQRVMIAMALANEPDLLIADEPTTALDVTVQAQILKLLKDIQTRLGMSMLFITHDLGIVRKVADRVCVMKRGKIVEQGAVERVFIAPEHPYTRALLGAEPKPNPAPLQPDAPIVVETNDLKVWFPVKRGVLRKVVGHIKAVDGVSIEIRKGETLGVVGESGSGKTTLGLAILRLISSDGPIVFLGKQLQGLKFKQMRPFRRDMQIVFQDPFGSLSPRMSISDIIEEGLWVHQPNLTAAECTDRVIRALSDVGLDPESRFRYPHEYSGGQRQRIAVARTLVLEPTFIVLDEPTSALDMLIQSQMVDLLRDLQKRRDLTYLFISHDLRVVAALASQLVVMRHGKVVEAGTASDVFANPRTEYTRALFAAAFNLETAPEDVVAQ
jgi:microcin C transport system ATP-binding protein